MRLPCRFCRRVVITILAVLSVFVACERAQAQSQPAGRLTGRITDTSGAALAGITLVITGPALTEPRTVVTDDAGRFDVATLPAGPVSVTCNAPGFVQWRREGIDVRPGAPVTLNFTMRREGETGAGPPTPEPPPPPPPAAHQLLEEIDRYLQKLDLGSIAFNAPERMLAGETTEMHLLLSPRLSVEALQEQLKDLPGALQGAQVRIAPQMEASLSGQNFTITGITPSVQAVSIEEPTEWRWEVTARSAGAHRLHLVLNATVQGTSRTLRTFDRTILVNVTWSQQLSGFARGNWQWLWTTALVPVAGWMWRRRKASRQTTEHSEVGQ